MEWERSYGSSGWDKVSDAALCSDTGVLMLGETNFDASKGKDIYIVRTDQYGDTLWTKTLSLAPNKNIVTSAEKGKAFCVFKINSPETILVSLVF